MASNPSSPSLRVDLWLRYVCLVKHRADATTACQGGHVKINGRRAKASSTVRAGDVVEMTVSRPRRFVVLEVPERAVSKRAGREMYRDESPELDKLDAIFATVPGADRERGAGRPTKRDRREMERERRKRTRD